MNRKSFYITTLLIILFSITLHSNAWSRIYNYRSDYSIVMKSNNNNYIIASNNIGYDFITIDSTGNILNIVKYSHMFGGKLNSATRTFDNGIISACSDNGTSQGSGKSFKY